MIVDDFQAATEELADAAQAKVLNLYARWKAGEITQADAELAIAGVINRTNAAAVSLADVYLVAQIEDAAGVVTPAVGVAPVDDAERLVKAVHTILTEPPKTKFTAAEIRDLIRSAHLDPNLYDVEAIRARVNGNIRDMLPNPDEPDYIPEDVAYNFEDFIEAVSEHPRRLADLGLWPPPPPSTGGIDPQRDAAYADWERKVDAARPTIDSDDYAGFQPIWDAEPEGAEQRLERLARAETFDTAQRATAEAMQSQDAVEGWTRQMDSSPCQLCRWWWREGRVWPKAHPFQRHKGCNCQPRVVVRQHIESTMYTRALERNRAS